MRNEEWGMGNGEWGMGIELFRVLDTPTPRPVELRAELDAFPYVNGDLFKDAANSVPSLYAAVRASRRIQSRALSSTATTPVLMTGRRDRRGFETAVDCRTTRGIFGSRLSIFTGN